MLLYHFTWQQFLVAALIMSLIWYLGVIPLLYRQKLKEFFNRKESMPVEPLRHEWDEELADEPQPTGDLLGKPVLPEGMSKVSMSMFGFAPSPDENEDERRQRQQSLVPDVIEELKSIFHILEKEQGVKSDFIALFSLVKAKYGAIRGTPDEQALNEYIRDHVLFPVSDEELTNLWR